EPQMLFEVMQHHGAALLGAGRRGSLQLTENPRIAERGTADHHEVAAGGLEHPARVLSRFDVSIPDDRHPRKVPLEIGDHSPVRGARVALATGARVNRKCRAPRPLELAGNLKVVAASLVPTRPDLSRHWQAGRLPDAADDGSGARRIAQQRRAGAAAG